jgi:hypothetical protein
MTEIQEGAQSDSIKGYKLPVTDVDTARRNFPGYEKKQWYNLEELREGDYGGTTDTDSETDVKTPGVGPYNNKTGYSKIQGKSAKMRPFKSSSARTKEN